MRGRRVAVLVGVALLHALLLLALLSWKQTARVTQPAAEPVGVWLDLQRAPVSTPPVERRAPEGPRAAPPVPAAPRTRRTAPAAAPAVPPGNPANTPDAVPRPPVSSASPPGADFGAAARQSAAAAVTQGAGGSTQMGATPGAADTPRQAGKAYPWGHQPLSKHFDIQSGVVTFRTKHCTVALLLVIAGFGCALGAVDPEPGRADLFDDKYRQPPLQLPKPVLPDPSYTSGAQH